MQQLTHLHDNPEEDPLLIPHEQTVLLLRPVVLQHGVCPSTHLEKLDHVEVGEDGVCVPCSISPTLSDSRKSTKGPIVTGCWKQYTFVMVTLVLLGAYQVTMNLDVLVEEGKPAETYAKSNKRDFKSINRNYFVRAKKETLSKDALHRRGPRSKDISCNALFNGEEEEIKRAHVHMAGSQREGIEDTDYIALTDNCTAFRNDRGYIHEPLSEEEAEFPLAFSLLLYKNVEQVERLLRAIYMPQNYYCIHVDIKAHDSVVLAMQGITRCFPNVFLASQLESVYWGHVSIITAEMTCLSDLLRYDWKYYINLSGQMFPLQTNRNLVRILKLYKGANDIEGTYQRNRHTWMIWRQFVSWHLVEWCGCLMMTLHTKEAAPHNITIYKGSNQVAVSRAFVRYALFSQPARDLLDWLKDTHAPDEYFLPTLNHNTHLRAPGGYIGDPETKVFTARASIWRTGNDQVNWSWKARECRGKWVRSICILGVGDLQWAFQRPELFLNKVFQDFEPLTLDCLEKQHYERTILAEDSEFIPDYYNNLDIVKYRELVNVNITD